MEFSLTKTIDFGGTLMAMESPKCDGSGDSTRIFSAMNWEFGYDLSKPVMVIVGFVEWVIAQ